MRKIGFLGIFIALAAFGQTYSMLSYLDSSSEARSALQVRSDQVRVAVGPSQTPSLVLPGQVPASGSDEKRTAEGVSSALTSPSVQPMSASVASPPQKYRASRKSSIHSSRIKFARHHHHKSSLFGSHVDIKEMLDPDASFLAAAKKGAIAQMNRLKGVANINALDDENGNTALYHAVKSGKNETASYLLGQPEINVNIKNENGRTVLHEACEHYNEAVITILLKNQDLNVIAKVHDKILKKDFTARDYLKLHAGVESTPQAKTLLRDLDMLFKKQKDYLIKHAKDTKSNEQLKRFQEYEDAHALDFEGLTPESYRTGCC